jgi:hypothetical protein
MSKTTKIHQRSQKPMEFTIQQQNLIQKAPAIWRQSCFIRIGIDIVIAGWASETLRATKNEKKIK